MTRLTKKYDDNSGYEILENNTTCNTMYDVPWTDVENCVDKLGKLEDLEEELGCPLEVVMQKIKELTEENKNNYNYCLEYDSFRKLWYIQDYCYYYGSYDVDNPELYLKDYQKTWWLKGEKNDN